MKKKLLCLLLALATVLTVLPVGALAQGTEVLLELETSVEAPKLRAAGPGLAAGTHEDWFDRLSGLPQYAVDFYGWLEDNRDAGEALADPTVADTHNDACVYELATLPGTVSYTYSTGEDPKAKAQEAVLAHAAPVFEEAMLYGVTVFSAFDRDHPEVFWLTGTTNWSWSLTYNYHGDGGTGTATYSMRVMLVLKQGDFDMRQSQYQTAAAVAEGIGRMEGHVADLLAGVPGEAPVSEQLRYLNRELTLRNAYNITASPDVSYAPWKATSALSGGEDGQGPVCEGYARALKVLCDRLGIGCTLVEGDAKATATGATQAHMWNYVQVDGGWYAVDVTWNDPVTSLSGDPAVSGKESEDWFLLGADSPVAEGLTFLQSHPVENIVISGGLAFVNGPVLAEDAYALPEGFMDIAPYRTGEGFTAPVMEGKVFGGWYADAAMTQPLRPEQVTGWAYAKFVDEATLSLKFQFTKGTTAQSERTDLRLLTAVDGLRYRAVSFRIGLGGQETSATSDRVYQQVRAGDSLISGPQGIFGQDAAYFVTYTVQNVPQSAFDMEFTVTPRWQTLDGTWVDGIERSFTIGGSC
ncbi:MAG: hypothetical protein II320_01580 [Oscillospiraceae bacterium]|nr:hypothetical protein [Oscillospiraceae bacterium]